MGSYVVVPIKKDKILATCPTFAYSTHWILHEIFVMFVWVVDSNESKIPIDMIMYSKKINSSQSINDLSIFCTKFRETILR